MASIKPKDPSITYLNALGYNVVRLPRTGIEPLDIIGKDSVTQYVGPISRVWHSAVPVPSPGPDHPATAVNGQKSESLSLTLGLTILANTLAAFGATVPSLDFSHTEAKAIQFSYANVVSSSIDLFSVGDYLAQGDLNQGNPVVDHYFNDPDSQTFLITEVLRSNAITITATDSSGNGVQLDVPAIQGAVGAKVGVNATTASTSTLTFTGPEAVTFGFRASLLQRIDGKWALQGVAASGGISFAVPVGFGADEAASAPPADHVVFDADPGSCMVSI